MKVKLIIRIMTKERLFGKNEYKEIEGYLLNICSETKYSSERVYYLDNEGHICWCSLKEIKKAEVIE